MIRRGVQFYYKIRTPPKRSKAEEEQKPDEARLRRIEQRKQKIMESRMFYRTFMETIPREEWRDARPTHRDSRALKAGGTDKNETWGSRHWKKNWYSQNEPVKYDESQRTKMGIC